MSEKRAQKGFTLLETLVALAVFAISMTALLGIFSAGVAAYQREKTVSEMQTLASNRLAAISGGIYFREREQSVNTLGEYKISESVTMAALPRARSDQALFHFTVEVSAQDFGANRTVSLSTYRIGHVKK